MEAMDRYISSTDWISLIFLISLLCLVFAKTIFYSRFFNFLILPFNNKYVILNNKKGKLLSGFHLAFSLFQLLNLALFGYFCILAFVPDAAQWDGLFVFWLVLGGLLAFTLTKVGVQLLGGSLFEIGPLISSLVFQKWSYLNYSSLVVLPVNLLIAYLFPDGTALVIIGIVLILAVNLIGWINLLKMHQSLISSTLFYFILYLCALEIAPFLIVYNLVIV